jgi:hypothetical protein
MSELLFCNKCGAVSCSNTIGDLCSSCLKGNLIGTTINFSKAYAEVIEEYKKNHNGDYPSIEESDEMLREKYFYNKLDNEVDYSAVKKRKYSESPEGVEEQNRITDRWYAKQNAQKFSTGPKCPICGSTNLKKITGTRKAMKIGLFGLFGAGDLGKTYQCGQCGAKF